MINKTCKIFKNCGGCQIDGLIDDNYTNSKTEKLIDILNKDEIKYEKLNPIETFNIGTRRKTTLKYDYGCNIGYYKEKTNDVIPLLTCRFLLPEINALLLPLKKLLKSLIKRSEGEITITKTTNGITIDFKGLLIMPLDDGKIKNFATENNIIRVTSNGNEIFKNQNPIIIFNDVKVAFPPKTFLQPSLESQNKITEIVLNEIKGNKYKTAADIFCGLGLFSFYLKNYSDEVLSFDCNSEAINELQRSANSYHLNINAKSTDIFTKPIKTEKLNELDLIIMDPPRDGAKNQSVEISKSNVKKLIYVSCSPITFARDAKILIDGGYKIKSITPIDQFPMTHHLELVAIFEK